MTRAYRVAAFALIAVVAFGVGARFGSGQPQASMMTGDGDMGPSDGGFKVDGVWYQFDTSVPWTAASGQFHLTGWPECLPRSSLVKGVRFAGSTVNANGNDGPLGRVLWVDCGSH